MLSKSLCWAKVFDNGTEIPGWYNYPIWNMYDRVLQDKPRTNNALEGWHNAFARDMQASHPPVHKIAEKYVREQKKRALDRRHHVAGRIQGTKRTRTKYANVNKRLKAFVERIRNNILVDLVYLEQVANVMIVPVD